MTTSRPASPVVPAVLVAALAGALIAAQSRFNADLAVAGAGTLVAGWLSYVGTLVTIAFVVLARRRLAATVRTMRDRARWWWFAIGLCGIPIVLASAYGVPIVGVAVASVASVAGQTVAGLLLDARGVGVPARLPLTGRRALAALTAIGGLGLAMAGGSSEGAGAGKAVAIGALFFVAGATLAAQNAGNGAVAQDSGDPTIAGLASATGGHRGHLGRARRGGGRRCPRRGHPAHRRRATGTSTSAVRSARPSSSPPRGPCATSARSP